MADLPGGLQTVKSLTVGADLTCHVTGSTEINEIGLVRILVNSLPS